MLRSARRHSDSHSDTHFLAQIISAFTSVVVDAQHGSYVAATELLAHDHWSLCRSRSGLCIDFRCNFSLVIASCELVVGVFFVKRKENV